MVTSGSSRQSSRLAIVAGFAASASAITAGREDMRDVVRVDGDHRDRLLAGQRSQHGDDLAARQAVAAGARRLDLDEVAILGVAAEFRLDDQLGLPAFDRLDPERAVLERAEDAEHGVLALLEDLHDAAGIGRAGRSRRSGTPWRAAGRRCRAPGRRRRAARGSRPSAPAPRRYIRTAWPAARLRRRGRKRRAPRHAAARPARISRLRSFCSRPSS